MPQDLRLSWSDVLVLSVHSWKVGFAGSGFGSFPKKKFGDVLVELSVMGVWYPPNDTAFLGKLTTVVGIILIHQSH